MNITRTTYYALIYASIVFFMSAWIFPLYVDGDQKYYRDFYKNCFYENFNFSIQYECYKTTIGSSEPIYFLIAKMANLLGFNKDFFIIISNTLFFYLLVVVVFKYYKKVWHRHLIIIFLLTNYYTIVLFFSAERLKFSFIFILIAILVGQHKKMAVVFLTIVTHVQSLLLFASYFIIKFSGGGDRLLKKVFTIFSTLLLLSAALYFMQSHLVSKFDAYSDAVGESGQSKT